MSQETRINIKVQPCASKTEVASMENDALRIRVAAPPEKGKANKELVNFLSTRLDVSKADVEITRGRTSRQKIVVVKDLSKQEIMRRLLPPTNLL